MESSRIPHSVRSSDHLREARLLLGLTGAEVAKMLNIDDARAVRRWEGGETPVPGYVTTVMETAMDYLRRIEALNREIEIFGSGEMRSGSTSLIPSGIQRVDTSEESVRRAKSALHDFRCALSILTRQPLHSEEEESGSLNWYDLEKVIRTGDASKDRFTLPNEVDVRRALEWFERHAGTGPLRFCLEDEKPEWVLIIRRVSRVQVGASWRLRPGEETNRFPIIRAEAADR